MNITFKQTIIKGVLNREFVKESIESNVVPIAGDYVKFDDIDGVVERRIIDYESNNITILLYPRDDGYVN